MLQPDSRTNLDAVRAYLSDSGRRDARARPTPKPARRPRTQISAVVDESRRTLWQERLSEYTRGRG
jgi:hypothetical protein